MVYNVAGMLLQCRNVGKRFIGMQTAHRFLGNATAIYNETFGFDMPWPSKRVTQATRAVIRLTQMRDSM